MNFISIQLTHDQRGQTLIELMAAMFVVTTGLLGVLGLTTANVRSETTAVMRLTAFNLAREGVELARNTRDSNWLSDQQWDTGLTLGTHCVIISTIPSATPFQSFKDASVCSVDLFDGAYRIFSSEGLYTQYDAVAPGAAVQTQYYRRVLLDPICLNKSQTELDNGFSGNATENIKANGGCDPVSETMIGMQVTSEVVYGIAGRKQSARIIERLYNWR